LVLAWLKRIFIFACIKTQQKEKMIAYKVHSNYSDVLFTLGGYLQSGPKKVVPQF